MALTEQHQLSGADEGPDGGGAAQTPAAGQPGETQDTQTERGFPQSPGPAAGIPLLRSVRTVTEGGTVHTTLIFTSS